MADKLFDFGIDPSSGLRCAGFEEDGQVIIVNQQPGEAVQQILDANLEHSEAALAHLRRRDSNGGFVARIPPITHWRWRNEWKAGPKRWGIPWRKFLEKKLRNPDNKKLRFANI